MPPRSEGDRIRDALRAIAKIQRNTEQLKFEEFQIDEAAQDIVILSLIVIGEACTFISVSLQQQAAHIPWTDIRAMRNRLIHEYFRIDLRIVWQVIEDYLPQLEATLRGRLEIGHERQVLALGAQAARLPSYTATVLRTCGRATHTPVTGFQTASDTVTAVLGNYRAASGVTEHMLEGNENLQKNKDNNILGSVHPMRSAKASIDRIMPS